MLAYAETNNGFIVEKILSAGLALLVVLASSQPINIFHIYVVTGYAHIALSFVYMAKTGKVTPLKTLLYFALVGTLFVAGYYFQREVMLGGAVFLMFHVYGDEVKFVKRQFNLPYFVLTCCLTAVVCSWLGAKLWNIEINVPLLWGPVLAATAAGIGLFIYERGRLEIEMYFVFLLAMLAVFAGMEFTGHRPLPVQALGFVILAHYMTYYYRFTQRFIASGNKRKVGIFGMEVLVSNLVFVACFVLAHYIWTAPNPMLKFGFTPVAFYVWSMSHFISTFKMADFKNILQLGIPAPKLKEAYT